MLSMKGFGFDGPKCAPSVFAALAVTQSTCSTMFDKTIRVILFPQSACVHLNAVFVCPILRAPELVNRIPAAGACVFSASVLSGNRFVLAFSPLEVARLLARPQPPPPPRVDTRMRHVGKVLSRARHCPPHPLPLPSASRTFGPHGQGDRQDDRIFVSTPENRQHSSADPPRVCLTLLGPLHAMLKHLGGPAHSARLPSASTWKTKTDLAGSPLMTFSGHNPKF